MPAFPSWADSAIEKQPACAAAISSSGFVPFPSSNRVLKEYCVLDKTPLSVDTTPLPSFKPPRHTAEPFLFICPRGQHSSKPHAAGGCDAHPACERTMRMV